MLLFNFWRIAVSFLYWRFSSTYPSSPLLWSQNNAFLCLSWHTGSGDTRRLTHDILLFLCAGVGHSLVWIMHVCPARLLCIGMFPSLPVARPTSFNMFCLLHSAALPFSLFFPPICFTLLQGWKKPGFFKKNPAQWVFLVFLFFLGFFGFFWVFGFFLPGREGF